MGVEEPKEGTIKRTKPLHSRHFNHEQIMSTKHVVVVECGTLPRTATKGNFRRQAVKDQYKELLDGLYGTVPKS